MRYSINAVGPFSSGILTGLALAGVALLTVRAVRRVRARRLAPVTVPVIDGVRPPDPILMSATPPPEANSFPNRVASDVGDPPPLSQRW